jgi:hypothetical protein
LGAEHREQADAEGFNASAGKFSGGKTYVSFAVKAGQGGGTLTGYSGDDQLPTTTRPGPSVRSGRGKSTSSAFR